MASELETNAFDTVTGATAAGYIIPEIWSKRIEEFAKAAVVVAPLGRQDNSLMGAGDVLNIAVDAELTAAAVAETAALDLSAIVYTQVTVTPAEYAVAVGVTRKLLKRSFNDVLNDQAKIMGYSLAKVKDSTIIAGLVAGAGNSVNANAVVTSAIASSDTLDEDDIAKARGEMRKDNENPKYFVIHPGCETSLIKSSQFTDASVYGGRETILGGEIGKYLGMKVLVTTLIPANSTTSTAKDNLMLSEDAFVVAQKMAPTWDMDYDILKRTFLMTAVEDWGYAVLRANAVCTVTAYAE